PRRIGCARSSSEGGASDHSCLHRQRKSHRSQKSALEVAARNLAAREIFGGNRKNLGIQIAPGRSRNRRRPDHRFAAYSHWRLSTKAKRTELPRRRHPGRTNLAKATH